MPIPAAVSDNLFRIPVLIPFLRYDGMVYILMMYPTLPDGFLKLPGCTLIAIPPVPATLPFISEIQQI